MPYGSRAGVKDQLTIPSATTTFDTEIDNLLTDTTRFIDMILKRYTSTPLQTDLLNELVALENLLAAGRFRARRSSPAELRDGKHPWEIEAENKLEEFLIANFRDTFVGSSD